MPAFRSAFAVALTGCLLLTSADPAVAAPSTAPSVQRAGFYVVKRGDTLSGIAERTGVSLDSLLSTNSLRSTSTIHPGQKLTIPVISTVAIIPGHFPDDLDTPDRRALIPLFRSAATDAGINTDLLMALVYVESGWSQAARSRHNAIGLGQLLPATATFIAQDLLAEPRLDPKKANDNLRLTAAYLRYLITAFPGNGENALAAYFEGESLVRQHGTSRQGKAYARRILVRRVMFSKVA